MLQYQYFNMARRLDPKFSEKNLASEKIISIRKNYFASEKKLLFLSAQSTVELVAIEIR